MNLQHKRKWFSATILAVIIPVSLLTAFKMTGIIPESLAIAQTIQCNPVSFEMERPSAYVVVDQRVENAYAENEAAARIEVEVSTYHENSLDGPFFYRDGITFIVHANFSALCGSGFSLAVKYFPADENASVYVRNDMVECNVSVTERKWFGNSTSEAHVKTEILDSPCYLKTQGYWVFNDENTMEHQLNVTLEVIHYNGTAYRKIVLPVRLFVWADAGNSFEEAKPIVVGNYTGFLGEGIPTPGHDDLEDYYALWVEENQTISIRMQPPANINFDLYLYDQNKNLLASSCSEQRGTAERIVATAEASGWYHIRVSAALGFGMYTLEVIS